MVQFSSQEILFTVYSKDVGIESPLANLITRANQSHSTVEISRASRILKDSTLANLHRKTPFECERLVLRDASHYSNHCAFCRNNGLNGTLTVRFLATNKTQATGKNSSSQHEAALHQILFHKILISRFRATCVQLEPFHLISYSLFVNRLLYIFARVFYLK